MIDTDDRQRLANFSSKREIDSYKQFLKPTIADNQEEYYGPIRPTIGPELSVSNIDKSDIVAYRYTILFIYEALGGGFDLLAMEEMSYFTADLKLNMSVEGTVLKYIFSNIIEYKQTQNIHEYPNIPQKKGLFGGAPKQPPPQPRG